MPLRTGDVTHESMIADEMVVVLAADVDLNIPEVHIERPLEVQRDAEKLTRGHLYIDVVDIGVTQSPLNSRWDQHEYEIHLVVRARPDTTSATKLSKAWVDQLKWYRNHAQALFGVKGAYKLTLSDGKTAHRTASQPFVLFGREQAYGVGVFIAPVQLNWTIAKK